MAFPDGVGGTLAATEYHTATMMEEDVQLIADVIQNVQSMLCTDMDWVVGSG